MFMEDASLQAFVASAGMRDSCGSERLHVAASETVVNSLIQLIGTEHMFDNFACFEWRLTKPYTAIVQQRAFACGNCTARLSCR